MILYYALGGGLGHLTRGRRVLERLGLARDAAFVTASAYAEDERVTGSIPVIAVPAHLEADQEAHRAWLRETAHGAERLIADTFPCGIHGELSGGIGIPMDLVARLLRWDEYRRAVPDPLPQFEGVWEVEELTPDHAAQLRAHSRRILPLALGCDDSSPTPLESPDAPYWLIVHSGPDAEVRELVEYTEELRRISDVPPERVLVATRCNVPLPQGYRTVDAYPASHLFEGAARLISAAGFNVMLETETCRDKHDIVPFSRRFDDQFLRASRRRERIGRADST